MYSSEATEGPSPIPATERSKTSFTQHLFAQEAETLLCNL